MSASWTYSLSLGLPIVGWAGMTELGQILPGIDCASRSDWMAIVSLASVSVGGLGACWGLLQTYRVAQGNPQRLKGYFYGLAGLCFVFATALQGTAVLLVNTCAR